MNIYAQEICARKKKKVHKLSIATLRSMSRIHCDLNQHWHFDL